MTVLIERSVDFTFARADAAASEGDGLTLEGYAAVFGQPTAIESWEGDFLETIRKGAFKKTISERTPVMQFDHGRHPLVGSIPIGVYEETREDDEGLYVKGRLSDNWLIEPVRDAIRDRAITGMSFRFEVVREEWRDAKGALITEPETIRRLMWYPKPEDAPRLPLHRTLVELKCPEAGPVVFPAYTGTAVDVRAVDLARSITADGRLRREVQRALVTDGLPADLLEDEALRGDVARALLFNTETTAPKAEPEPEAQPEPEGSRSETEPPAPEGHPAEDTDAPPTVGHPSPPTDSASRQAYLRRAYVTSHGVGKKYT